MSETTAVAKSAPCPECGHQYADGECVGPPTPSDLWAGVSVSGCDCDGLCSDDTEGNP